jgi:hypothetical protein
MEAGENTKQAGQPRGLFIMQQYYLERLIVYAAASRQLPINPTYLAIYPTMPAAQTHYDNHTAHARRDTHPVSGPVTARQTGGPDRIYALSCCLLLLHLHCTCVAEVCLLLPRSLIRSHDTSVMAGQSNASRLEHHKLCLVQSRPLTPPQHALGPLAAVS